jgi:hypothetical protein
MTMSKMILSCEWLRIGVLMAVATGLCGCATIINGKKQTITINTEPVGATARVRGQAQAIKTPGTVTVNRIDLITLLISRDGYKTKQVNLDREMSPWIWGNLPLCALILSPLGIAFDGLSGGGSVQRPSVVNVALEALHPGEQEKAGPIPLPGISGADLLKPSGNSQKVRICVFSPYPTGDDFFYFRILDNDDAVGLTRARTYLCWEREPGPATISVSDDRHYAMELKTVGGHTYFLEQTAGAFSGLKLRLIDDKRVAELLAKCVPAHRSRYIQYQ